MQRPCTRALLRPCKAAFLLALAAILVGSGPAYAPARGSGSGASGRSSPPEDREPRQPIDILAMGCASAACDFQPLRLRRRPLGEHDVLIDMKYCGVCHSDLCRAANLLSGMGIKATYPCVPGHELSGVCAAVGPGVARFKVGDHVGVGPMVDSCQQCPQCRAGCEQKCSGGGCVGTYQTEDKYGRAETYPKGGKTIGGYCTRMVVHEDFGIPIPRNYPLECAGPVMCAGVTMYDPLKTYGCKAGTSVGILGLGGLGVLGIKIAKAMGAEVTAFSRSAAKRELAISAGADGFVAVSDEAAVAARAGTLDLILDTIPAYHDITPYQRLLSESGKLVVLGLNPTFAALKVARKYLGDRGNTVSSYIGGTRSTQEVLELCATATPQILPRIELRPVQDLNEVFTRLASRNDAGVRYVLDLQGSLNERSFVECSAPPPKLREREVPFRYRAVVKELVKLMWSQRG